jgi:DNA-binding transcriptional LysR family regulator
MIDLMSTFVAVVEAGSFSEAGRRTGQQKTTVSQRVHQLEERLGVRLLQRSTRAVQPTQVGRAYYERCVRILADIDEAEQLARQDQTLPSGELRIQLPIELGMHIFGKFLVEFASQNPEVSLHIELSSRRMDMIDERYDLAIRTGTMPDSSLVSRRILSIRRGFYASAGYLNEHGEPKAFEDLRHHSCLRFQTDYFGGEWIANGPHGKVTFNPSGVVTANNLAILQDAAVAGLGIALLPALLCKEQVESGVLKPILLDWVPEEAEVFVLYPSRHHLSAKVSAFLAFLDTRRDKLSVWINRRFELFDSK